MTDEHERIELAESVVQVRLLGIWLSEAMNLNRHEVATDLADRIAQHLKVVREALAKVKARSHSAT